MKSPALALAIALATIVSLPGRAEDAATVRAERYRTRIFEGGLDAIHDAGIWIEELYFPGRGVVCNVAGGRMNAFFGGKRNFGGMHIETPVEQIDVPRETAEAIFALAELSKRQQEEAARLGARVLGESLLHADVTEPTLWIPPLEPPLKIEIGPEKK